MPSSRPPARDYGFLRPARHAGWVRVYKVTREAVLEARADHYAPDVAVLERVAEQALRDLADLRFINVLKLRAKRAYEVT